MNKNNFTAKTDDLINSIYSINVEKILITLMLILSLYFVISKPSALAFGFLSVALLVPIFFRYPKNFFLILIAGKMIVNGLYNQYIYGGINVLKIIGAIVPILLIIYILIKRIDFRSYQFYLLIFLFVLEVILSSFLTIYTTRNFADAEKFLRLLNGISCYFAIPLLIKSKKDIRLLLTAWAISVCVPITLGVYQIFTGHLNIQQATGIIGFYRLSGIYHDVVSMYYAGLILIMV